MANQCNRCWGAFYDGNKEDALRLLPKVQKPEQEFVFLEVENGWDDDCQQLVESYHLSPSDRSAFVEYRPLHLACMSGRVQVVKYLLTLPFVMLTIIERDDDGTSALDCACSWEHLPVIKLLLREPSVHMPNHLFSHKFPILFLLSTRMI